MEMENELIQPPSQIQLQQHVYLRSQSDPKPKLNRKRSSLLMNQQSIFPEWEYDNENKQSQDVNLFYDHWQQPQAYEIPMDFTVKKHGAARYNGTSDKRLRKHASQPSSKLETLDYNYVFGDEQTQKIKQEIPQFPKAKSDRRRSAIVPSTNGFGGLPTNDPFHPMNDVMNPQLDYNGSAFQAVQPRSYGSEYNNLQEDLSSSLNMNMNLGNGFGVDYYMQPGPPQLPYAGLNRLGNPVGNTTFGINYNMYGENDMDGKYFNRDGSYGYGGHRTDSSDYDREENDDLKKGPWTKEEDELLKSFSALAANKNWTEISEKIPGRTPKQIRERWCYNLDPDISKDLWAPEEDLVLLERQKVVGNKWALIAHDLPGRTENAVKTRYKSIMRAVKKEWTQDEDEKILNYYDEMGPNWKKISSHLRNRSKHAVKMRFRQFIEGLDTLPEIEFGKSNQTVRQSIYNRESLSVVSAKYKSRAIALQNRTKKKGEPEGEDIFDVFESLVG